MALDTKTHNAMDRFVAQARDVFAEVGDTERRWELLRPALADLLADPQVQEAAKSWPLCQFRDGRAENLLFYEDPDYGFVINGLTKSSTRTPGERTLIHDHAHIYTLYGVLTGEERIERYDRVDDRSKPDYAEIQRADDTLVGPGDIDLVKPFEVHAEVSTGSGGSAVIIRSERAGGFNQGRYDPETNRYWESLGPRQVETEMLPARP